MSQDATRKTTVPVLSQADRAILSARQSTQLDLSPLSEVERKEMVRRIAEGRIELAKKAGELAVENQALDQRLDAWSIP